MRINRIAKPLVPPVSRVKRISPLSLKLKEREPVFVKKKEKKVEGGIGGNLDVMV